MTKLYLITGFLGSGKTTFLKNLLLDTSHTIGVLMNEFGQIDIDGTIIEENDITMTGLTNGSIFCSCLKDSFIRSLRELILQNLDYIYIESSGLADPANMLTIIDLLHRQCNEPFSYLGSICLVDGLHFLKEYDMMVSVDHQIRHSGLIILNKIDLIKDATRKRIIQKIASINPQATLLETTYGKVSSHSLEMLASTHVPPGRSSNTTANRPKTITITLMDTTIPLETITTLLEQIKIYCYRIKGFITLNDITYKIDTVNDKLDIITYNQSPSINQTLVCISKIGTGILTKIYEAVDENTKNRLRITT